MYFIRPKLTNLPAKNLVKLQKRLSLLTKTGTTATKKDDGFPVWAIILIVLLVLALCVLCPVILVLGGVISLFQGALIVLPFI